MLTDGSCKTCISTGPVFRMFRISNVNFVLPTHLFTYLFTYLILFPVQPTRRSIRLAGQIRANLPDTHTRFHRTPRFQLADKFYPRVHAIRGSTLPAGHGPNSLIHQRFHPTRGSIRPACPSETRVQSTLGPWVHPTREQL